MPSELPCTPTSDWSSEAAQLSRLAPYLVVALRCDRPATAEGGRFSLIDANHVVFERTSERKGACWRSGRGRRELLVPDTRISRMHARLFVQDEAWVLEDLDSTNGTWLNGERIHRAPLEDGDVINVGHTIMVFRAHGFCGTWERSGLDQDELRRRLNPFPVTLSASLHDDFLALRRAARTDAPIRLSAESGLGRARIVRAIHQYSYRRGRLLSVGSDELRGESLLHVLRAAAGGTLFVDELADLSRAEQARFADAWASAGNVRLVVNSRRSWTSMAMRARLCEELSVHLAGLHIEIPPLRERREDLGLVLAWLLREIDATGVAIRPLAAAALFRHPWPGNLDELRGALRHAVSCASGALLDIETLRPWIGRLARLKASARAAWRDGLIKPRAPVSVANFCALVDDCGVRCIAEAEYRELVAMRDDFDLFIDLMAKTGRGRCTAVRRDDNGRVEEIQLQAAEAAALVELVERGIAMRPADLQSINVVSPDRAIQRGRAKVDVRRDRYKWRSFHTLADTGEKRFVFNPPGDLRYAVLRPIE